MNEKQHLFQIAARASSVGFCLIGALFFFLILGFSIDKWLKCFPLFSIIGLFLGFGGGMWLVLRIAEKLQGDKDNENL